MLINKTILKMASVIKSEITKLSLLTLIAGIITILQAFFISKMITNIMVDFELTFKYFIYYIALVGIQIFLKYPTNDVLMNTEAKIKISLRKKCFEKLFKLGLTHLDEERTGKLSLIFLDRIEALAPYCSMYIPSLFNVTIVSLGCILYLAVYDIRVTLIAFIGAVAMLFVPILTYKYLWSTGIGVWNEYENFSAEFLDNIQGMETLKNLKACDVKKEEMLKLSKEIHKKTMDNMKITTIENFLFELFANLGSIISVAFAAYLALRGQLQIADVVAILFLVRSCFTPVYTLMNAWHLGYNGLTASNVLDDFLNEELPTWREGFISDGEKDKLKIKNLSFSYDSKEEVLKNININIEKGKTYALVGKSGDGKSTLAALIAGLYPYTKGKIEKGNLTLQESSVIKWRESIGAVWQSPYIFHCSLRENLLFAKENASDEELEKAILDSGLSDVVNALPQGMDTLIGENGSSLSGGEKQRVAIARCFLKNPELLIFDEATSNLDEKNEKYIKESIEKISKGRTVIIIAHKLSTISDVDCCYMMKNGEIIAEGNYEKLLNSCSEFKNLVNSRKGKGYA